MYQTVETAQSAQALFSPQLAELILAGGTEDPLKPPHEVTVVFLDLRGFTTYAEQVSQKKSWGTRDYHAEMGNG
jgi:class 3 adenylate cyclase